MNHEAAMKLADKLGDECVEYDVQVKRTAVTGRQFNDGKTVWVEIVITHTVGNRDEDYTCWSNGTEELQGMLLTFETIQEVIEHTTA